MSEEEYLGSRPQSVTLVENLICVKWKPKHDQPLSLGNEERIICSISNTKSFFENSIKVSCLTHLEFHEINLSDYPTAFWECHGEKIKSLKLSYCIVKLNTVSSIIKYCTSLVTFGLRISDSFVQTENPFFNAIFECLINQGKTVVPSVETLEIVMKKTSPAPCVFDQTILNLLKIFFNFKSLTLKHNCDSFNYTNHSSSTSPSNNNRIFWKKIFDLIKKKSHGLNGLNIEFSSPLRTNCVWQQALNRKFIVNNFRLTEVTFEMVPVKRDFPRFETTIKVLQRLENLRTITCKLLHQECFIDSVFLNELLRDLIKNCLNLLHLKIEYFQSDTWRKERNQWGMDFELLRGILISNLMSFHVHVDCCDIFLKQPLTNIDNSLKIWWNGSIEYLYFSFICKTDDGQQHQIMADFISQLESLKHLHLGGDINDDVLKSIWIHLKTLKSLSLYVSNSSVITEAGFMVKSTEMGNHFSEEEKKEEEEEDISKNLEYLRFRVQKEKSSSENELELPANIFKKFSEFEKLRYISFGVNNKEAETVINLLEQLENFQLLKGLFIECNVKETHIDFLYNTCRYCPCLERIYIKNNHSESKSFSVYQYKDFFRYCTSLKLLTHENGKAINRWFKEDGKVLPERISEDDEIYFISTDVNDAQPNFWFSLI